MLELWNNEFIHLKFDSQQIVIRQKKFRLIIPDIPLFQYSNIPGRAIWPSETPEYGQLLWVPR